VSSCCCSCLLYCLILAVLLLLTSMMPLLLLSSLMLIVSLHAVAGYTTFASLPAAVAAVAATALRPPSPFREARRSSLSVLREGVRRQQVWPPPFAPLGAVQRRRQRPPVFLLLPLRFQCQEVQEGLLLPGNLIDRRPAHTPPPPPDLFKPAAPSTFSVPESATAMSFLPAKNLIFLQDSQNNFKFLVNSGADLCAAHRPAPCGSQWQASKQAKNSPKPR
jgi:hypothetical protein